MHPKFSVGDKVRIVRGKKPSPVSEPYIGTEATIRYVDSVSPFYPYKLDKFDFWLREDELELATEEKRSKVDDDADTIADIRGLLQDLAQTTDEEYSRLTHKALIDFSNSLVLVLNAITFSEDPGFGRKVTQMLKEEYR